MAKENVVPKNRNLKMERERKGNRYKGFEGVSLKYIYILWLRLSRVTQPEGIKASLVTHQVSKKSDQYIRCVSFSLYSFSFTIEL